VALVVHVKAVRYGMVLEVCDESCDIYSGHCFQVTREPHYRVRVTHSVFDVLRECAHEIGEVVKAERGRGLSGLRESQYHLDVAADEVARRVLVGSGFRVVSEESGVTGEGESTVVIDPIDGSTNCDRGVPFFATSMAVMRDNQLIAAVVVDQTSGMTFEAERGGGATRDATSIQVSGIRELSKAIIAFSGLPSRHLGWAQYRALGAASLELCYVADGSLDAYTVAQQSTLHPWDYLAGLLIAREAGGVSADYRDEELETCASVVRRPAIACTAELLETILRAGAL
jgi:myo-inositol-1(or 4)-monophosphatase